MLRVLYVPILNYPNNINADSIYLISRDWCRRLCEAHPDVAVYFLHPEMGRESDVLTRYRGEYKPCHERVHDVFVPMATRYDFEEVQVPFDVYRQFHPMLGERPVNAVVCTSSLKTIGVKRLFTSGALEGADTPTHFNFELLLRGMGSNEVAGVHPDEMRLQAIGETMAWNLWESPKCKSIATRSAARFLSIAGRQALEQNGDMVYSGFDDALAQPLQLDQRHGTFSVIVRGRLTGSKNVDKILDIYNRFYAGGRKVQMIVTTGDVKNKLTVLDEAMQTNRTIQLKRFPGRDAAVEEMRKCHAFVIWSSHELFCVSAWEMLAAGLLGVFKKEDWLDGLLPPGYPYVADGSPIRAEREAYSMICDIMDNYEQRLKELAWVREWVVERYAYRNTTKVAGDVIKARTQRIKPREWIVDILKKHGWDEMTIARASQLAAVNSEEGDNVLPLKTPHRMHRAVGPLELHEALLQAGYEDLLGGAPVYRRR